MIESHQRPDSRLQQCVDEPAVIIDAFGTGRARTIRLNARPGDRKAIAVQIHRPHQRDVFMPTMVGITRNVARVAILDVPRVMRKSIPDRLALAVFLPRAFDLISRSGGAPEKVLGKWSLGDSIELYIATTRRCRGICSMRRIRHTAAR